MSSDTSDSSEASDHILNTAKNTITLMIQNIKFKISNDNRDEYNELIIEYNKAMKSDDLDDITNVFKMINKFYEKHFL